MLVAYSATIIEKTKEFIISHICFLHFQKQKNLFSTSEIVIGEMLALKVSV
jgi:hypothetical protein